MKGILIFLFFLFFQQFLIAQVGVNTATPTATLDVNGTFKVRSTIREIDLNVIRDSVIVISKSGIVNTASAIDIINAGLPSMVKASFSGSGNINHIMSVGVSKLTFDNETVDNNDEFDTATNTFTAKQNGIYSICSQIKLNSTIGVSTNFGLGIYKNNILIAEQNYTSIVILGNNVSSPIRYVHSTIDLSTNDTIQFKLKSTLPSVDIFGNDTESYCYIYQIR